MAENCITQPSRQKFSWEAKRPALQRTLALFCNSRHNDACAATRVPLVAANALWRAPPHCRVVNLVRSGRKQPKLFSTSAGDQARLPFSFEISLRYR